MIMFDEIILNNPRGIFFGGVCYFENNNMGNY